VFGNLSWEHILVLVVVGLVILGPERLPGAIRWTSNALRQARDYLSGVTSQLREDLGPEFDDLRGPLSELQRLRGMTPRAALTKHLLDGDDSFLTGNFDRPVNGAPARPSAPAEPSQPTAGSNGGPTTFAAEPHAPGHTPFDTDAT
jgi:sec-independent protein translocase protein TatB